MKKDGVEFTPEDDPRWRSAKMSRDITPLFTQSRHCGMLTPTFCASDSNVLIEGASGTGKELVAMEIVKRGPRVIIPLELFKFELLHLGFWVPARGT